MTGDKAGFTLVEILVVIAIISVLAGLVTVSVQQARKFADRKATQTEIQQLVQAATSFETSFGDYPPTFLSNPPLGLTKTNEINEGNESLIAHITTRKKGGPFHEDFKDDRLSNLDSDRLSQGNLTKVRNVLSWTRGNAALLEYCDIWGNPFVYIHNRDYRGAGKIRYLDADGKRVEVQAAASEKTGTFQSPTSFQIWSFGPNRTNENGTGDDITSWQ